MKAIHKISACLLAMLLLFSTSAFAVNIHYCGEHFAGVSFFGTEMICGMENMQVSENSSCHLHTESCCHIQKITVQGQNKLQATKENLTPYQQIFVAAFFITYTDLFQNIEEQVIPFKNYTPPLLVKDIQVLDETYLI